jgi:hypothetical protein
MGKAEVVLEGRVEQEVERRVLCDSGKTGIEGLGECVEFLRCSGLEICGTWNVCRS